VEKNRVPEPSTSGGTKLLERKNQATVFKGDKDKNGEENKSYILKRKRPHKSQENSQERYENGSTTITA
jgi:predicted small secreted protein